MYFSPINYSQPLFRPPAEAYSAIIQATIGCSWNKCTFCEMYSSKKFSIRKIEDIYADISILASYYSNAKRVFIADGDAFMLQTDVLLNITNYINSRFKNLQRISLYATPRSILSKSENELQELKKNGIKLLYIGVETGDDELLKLVNKNETFESNVKGILKAHNAGIDTSIIILNGLGGKLYSNQHAINSAKLINLINPKFLSTLTLSFPYGKEHYCKKFNGKYESLSLVDLYKELLLFIENLYIENVIFRSNHVSNNINLEGVLCKDKQNLINMLNYAIETTPLHMQPHEPETL